MLSFRTKTEAKAYARAYRKKYPEYQTRIEVKGPGVVKLYFSKKKTSKIRRG